jgi:hypothetical protein
MAPILWFVTSGDTHHEEAFQSRSGDVYFSPFLLLSHHYYEFHVRPRLGFDMLLRVKHKSRLRSETRSAGSHASSILNSCFRGTGKLVSLVDGVTEPRAVCRSWNAADS